MSSPRFTAHGFDVRTIWPAVCHYMRLGATIPATRLLQETYSWADKKFLITEFMTFLIGNYGRLHVGLLEAHDQLFTVFGAKEFNEIKFGRSLTELVHMICNEPGKSRLAETLLTVASVPQIIKKAVELPIPSDDQQWFHLEKGCSVSFQFAMLKLQTALTTENKTGDMIMYAAALIHCIFHTQRPDWKFSATQISSFSDSGKHFQLNRIPKKYHSIYLFLAYAVVKMCSVSGSEFLSVTFHYSFTSKYMELCLMRAAIVAKYKTLNKKVKRDQSPSLGTFADFKKMPMDDARALMPTVPEECFLFDPVTSSYQSDSRLFRMSDELRSVSHPLELEEKKSEYDYVMYCSKIRGEDTFLAELTSPRPTELTFLKTSDRKQEAYVALSRALLRRAIKGKTVNLKKDYLEKQDCEEQLVETSSESDGQSDSGEDDFEEQMFGNSRKRKRSQVKEEESESSEAEQGDGTSESEQPSSESDSEEED